jgi:hypothetical protein
MIGAEPKLLIQGVKRRVWAVGASLAYCCAVTESLDKPEAM